MSIDPSEIKKLDSVDFDVEFTPDSGDTAPPNVDKMIGNMDQGDKLSTTGSQIDYSKSLYGFWSFIDLIMQVVSKSTKGTIEYEKMDTQTLNSLAIQSSQSTHFQKLAVMENAPTWLVVANAIGQFGTRIKYNPPKKEEKKKSENQLSKSDIEILKRVANTPKPQKVVKEIETPATQGDVIKLLDSDDLSSEDKKTLRELINSGELDSQIYQNNKNASKSRAQLIKEEEELAEKRRLERS